MLRLQAKMRSEEAPAQSTRRQDWAATGGLRGIGDSLYTPFSCTDGDDIDWKAYRSLVRYCVGDLGHSMLWLTCGVGEWRSLTIEERKKLLVVAIEEARAIARAPSPLHRCREPRVALCHSFGTSNSETVRLNEPLLTASSHHQSNSADRGPCAQGHRSQKCVHPVSKCITREQHAPGACWYPALK